MEEKEGIRPHSCQVQNRSSVRLTGMRTDSLFFFHINKTSPYPNLWFSIWGDYKIYDNDF